MIRTRKAFTISSGIPYTQTSQAKPFTGQDGRARNGGEDSGIGDVDLNALPGRVYRAVRIVVACKAIVGVAEDIES